MGNLSQHEHAWDFMRDDWMAMTTAAAAVAAAVVEVVVEAAAMAAAMAPAAPAAAAVPGAMKDPDPATMVRDRRRVGGRGGA